MKNYAKILAALICSVCVFAFAGCGEATIVSNPYADSSTSSDSSGSSSGSNSDNSGSGSSGVRPGSGSSSSDDTGSGNTDTGSGSTDTGSGSTDAGSDEEDLPDLLSALAYDNLYNVTVDVTAISSYETLYMNIKSALTYDGTCFAGSTYAFSYADDEEETQTEYEVWSSNYCAYVCKYAQSGEYNEWYGEEYNYQVSLISAYDELYDIFEEIADAYGSASVVAYNNGVFTFSDTYGNYIDTYTITMSGGYITTVNVSTNYGYEYVLNFSNYGTTTVTVPYDYTYSGYLANNSGSGSGSADAGSGSLTELLSSLAVENLLNVTVTETMTETITYSSADVTETTSYTGTATIKSALTYNGTYFTGNSYSYMYAAADGMTAAITEYEALTATSASYVSKTSVSGYTDVWDGYLESGYSVDASELDALNDLYLIFQDLEELYDEFEYSDGYYEFSDGYLNTNYDYVIKISGGYITSMTISVTETSTSNGVTTTDEATVIYNFSNYGTTTVTIPTEYTYSYYLANNAG